MAFAKIQLIGNVGRDPELRYTPNGRPVASFSVAVSHNRKNPQTGEWEDGQTDWFNVSVWGDLGERIAETVHKGSKVFIDGRFKTREYEANTGGKRTSMDVTADTVIDVGKRRDDDGESQASSPRSSSTDPTADDADDLPF